MKKFEKLKNMNLQEAQAFIAKIVGEDLAKKFFDEEPTTTKVSNAEVGSFVKYAGLEWVVLNKTKGKVMVLAKHRLFDRAFDTNESNNWSESSLRKELNNFNEQGFQRGFENINKMTLLSLKEI